jgi:hypothetical protein
MRDGVSGEILLARPLLSEREADLVTLRFAHHVGVGIPS